MWQMRCILPPAKDDRTHYEDQYQQPGNQFNMLLHQSVKIDSIATKPLVLYIFMGANLNDKYAIYWLWQFNLKRFLIPRPRVVVILWVVVVSVKYLSWVISQPRKNKTVCCNIMQSFILHKVKSYWFTTAQCCVSMFPKNRRIFVWCIGIYQLYKNDIKWRWSTFSMVLWEV